MLKQVAAERWKQIKEIFDEAAELGESERVQYLDSACFADADLREAVEKMLAIDDESESFLEESPLEILEKSHEESLLNQQIGSYKLLKEIGRGGMGAVYLAQRDDDEFEKKVAVKIVKRGMDTDDILRRFRHERQILAGLEHPNIARLIDGGTTTDGLPYFVLEYVEGEDIISYSNSQNLTINERLKLFCEVCNAVQFAHQNLVVHRDLKPSNIIISQNGTPKLLDFGISKLLTATDDNGTVTSLGIMTPAYASPEQANGKNVTTATDVYSLGVVLYELLTGQMPYKFDSNNPNEMAQIISSTEPQKPSVAAHEPTNPKSKIQNPKSLRGDLDNIVLMALRKNVERRYASVEQFSEDIRRYLANLPVRARGDTFAYRATKFIQRNRVGAIAGVLVFLTLLGGIISTWRQARIAENERNLAEERFNEVRELANNVVFKYHDEIKNLPGSTKVREMLVKDALNYLDRLAQNSATNPNLQRELARAYMKVGDVQGEVYNANTGDTAGAIESYRKAVGLLEPLEKDLQTDVSYLTELNSAYRGLGLLLLRAADLTSSDYLKKAFAISQKLFEIEPSTVQRIALIRTQISVGDTVPKVTGEGSRKEIYQQAYSMAEELFRAEPENADVIKAFATVSSRLGYILSVLANSYLTTEQKDLAEKLYQEAEIYQKNATNLAEKLAASNPNNTLFQRSLMVGRLDLSETECELGQVESALKTQLELYRKINETIQSDPANLESKADKSDICDGLGTTNLKLKNYAESIGKYKEGLSLLEQNILADKGNLELKARIYKITQHLGDALLAQGEAENAIREYQTAYQKLEENHPNKERLAPWHCITAEKIGDAYFYLATKPNVSKEKKIQFLNLAKEEYEKALKAKEIPNLPPTLFGENRERLETIQQKLARCLDTFSN